MTVGSTTAPEPLAASTIVGIAAAGGLVPLNSTMVAVALPRIASDFDIETSAAGILITAYLIVMLIGQPLAGRVVDRVGGRQTVVGALVGLMACSIVAAAAPSYPVLVGARTLQACFAATLSPAVQSLLRSLTPPDQQGRSFGLMGAVQGTGAAAGPVIGGGLTQAFGWESIFLVNVPICLLALVVAIRVSGTTSTSPSEAVGSADHNRILNPVFVAAFSIQALTVVAQYGLLLLTPIILDAQGWEPGGVGLALSALTLGMIVMGPRGGRSGDRLGRRAPSRLGLAVATAAVAVVAIGGDAVAPWILILALGLFGLGLGFTTPNLTTGALESVGRRQTGSAAGVLSMSRYVGSITSSILVSALVASDASGSQQVLVMASIAMALTLAVVQRLPGQVRNAASCRGATATGAPER